jgi:hypothetical protein
MPRAPGVQMFGDVPLGPRNDAEARKRPIAYSASVIARQRRLDSDVLEFALYMALCHGEIGLDEARHAFATNWIEAYRRYGRLLQQYRHGSAD